MFLIDLFRFLAGYVLFCAVGGFPERFINLCTAGKIPVWDICPKGDTRIPEGRPTRTGK